MINSMAQLTERNVLLVASAFLILWSFTWEAAEAKGLRMRVGTARKHLHVVKPAGVVVVTLWFQLADVAEGVVGGGEATSLGTPIVRGSTSTTMMMVPVEDCSGSEVSSLFTLFSGPPH